MQKFVHLLIIFSLTVPSMVRAEDYCIEKKPQQERRVRDPKEVKSIVAAVAFSGGSLTNDLLTHFKPEWVKAALLAKYTGQFIGMGAILSIALDVISAGAGDEFTNYYKKHPDQLQKLAKLSDNELKTLAATDETGEFARMIKTARASNSR